MYWVLIGDVDEMKWESKIDRNGFKRMHHAAGIYGSMMTVYGGYDDELRMIHFDF